MSKRLEEVGEKLVFLIEDERLTPELNRTRSGSEQQFYYGNKDKNPLFTLTHPSNKAMYAELIDGKWYWVNGCNKCKGMRGSSYVTCQKHDGCESCGCSRGDFEGNAWGSRNGWICGPCYDKEWKEARWKALSAVAAMGDDKIDCEYNSNIVCPHCASVVEPCTADGLPEGEEECCVCGGVYYIEPDVEITYSTKIVGERVTL